jgi:SpoVK/Ycf46/Vps4 family AAA+-type ATPase
MLDKALIRPGRFDKIIYMGPPDAAAREAIFRHYLEGKPTVSADINYQQLAASSERFTGADIRAVVDKVLSGAFYSEVKDKKEALITHEMLAEAIKTTRPSIDFSMLEEYERFRATYQRDRLVTKGWESEIPDVRFEDIGDLDHVKTELRESFELPLRRPDLMEKLKVRPVKGVLLYGPPGNGKTLLAKAVATEVAANFFIISGAELAKTGANDAASKVKDLFNLAKENVPSIIFIDEIDQLAPDRSSSEGSAFVPVTTQLLSELDGVKALKGVMILAATNRPEAIDQALLRANRIEKHVLVPPPDERGREEILGIYLRDVKLSDDVIIKELAKMTDGFSGADLQGFVNEAKKSVIRSSLMGDVRDWLNMGDFKAALQAKAASSIKNV